MFAVSTLNSLCTRIKRELDEDTTFVTVTVLSCTVFVSSSLLDLIATSKAPSLMLLRVCTPTTVRLSNTLSPIESRLSVPTKESRIRRKGQAPPHRCS